jgi:pimeloyl-ACP methyl ester carboxylesterase
MNPQVPFSLNAPSTITLKRDDAGLLGTEQRQVQFQLSQAGGGDPSSVNQAWPGQKVWIISHGWNSSPQRFTDLATAIGQKNPNDIVLTLDWSQAASTPNNGLTGNFDAGRWIGAVAAFAAQKLKDWGLSDGSNLNLVGHSLGALLSGELAAQFGQVATITALEPPSELNLQLFGSQYDLDGNQAGVQRPRSFQSVSEFSRAFVGTQSLSASTDFAKTADESVLVDFNSPGVSLSEEHGRVIDTFTQLVRASRPLVDDLLSLDDQQVNPQFRRNSLFRTSNADNAQQRQVYEARLKVDGNNVPLSLSGRKLASTNSQNDLILGTAGDDRPITLSGGRTIIPLLADQGTDTLTGGAGSDWFVFDVNRTFSASLMGTDEITDFAVGVDRLGLDKTTFTLLSSPSGGALAASEFAQISSDGSNARQLAGASSAKIVFDTTSQGLFYNPNGAMSGIRGGGQFATLTDVASLSARDFVVLA